MRRPSTIPVSLFAVAALLAMAAPTRAAVVLDRATLNSIVGGLAISENFEAYQIAAGGALAFTGIDALTSGTILTSGTAQGPGLVVPGVTFTGSTVQWNAQNYYGAPSREILFNSTALTINFSTPATAFGVDLRNFAGYSSTATVTVFAANGTTVLYSGTGLTLTGTAQFFGFQDAGGIGRVTFTTTSGNGWSPIIDNLTFAIIPEPSVVALMLAGLGLSALVWHRRHPRAARVASKA